MNRHGKRRRLGDGVLEQSQRNMNMNGAADEEILTKRKEPKAGIKNIVPNNRIR
ncbi:hypothetical protein GCM10027415_15310 [Humibacter ginsengisoli]